MHRLTELQIDAKNYEPTQDYIDCYFLVKEHLSVKCDNSLVWQKCYPSPPFQEHISFHLGNQSFFVRLYDINEELEEPGNQDGTFKAGKLFNGISCYIAVEKVEGEWVVAADDWGLFLHQDRAPDYPNDKPIHPPTLVTDENIPLNIAEYHFKAVWGVCQTLSETFPDADFYPPNYYRSARPHIIMSRPNKAYDEAFIIFTYRSLKEMAENRKAKLDLDKSIEHLMDFGFKTYVLNVVLFSEDELENKTIEIIPLHRGEEYIATYERFEDLGLI